MEHGTWVLPTRGRPAQLQAMLDQCVATGMSTPGTILVSRQDHDENGEAYTSLRLPRDWAVMQVESEGLAAKIQEWYAGGLGDAYRWIGLLTDDQMPITQNWDTALIAGIEGWNIVTSDDCDQAPKRMEGATIWSRDLVDEIGYLAPPGLAHLFFDDVWEKLGAATGCLRWNMDVKVKHSPRTYAPNADPTAMAVRNFHATDELRFREWMRAEYPAACEAVFRVAEKHGVKVSRPDLKGVSLYLSTPDGDGRPDRIYTKALIQTIEMVRAAGGQIDWGEHPYCADLSLARARLFGAFLKSSHTHMLMVDDDMGWNPHDVLRLIETKLDLVGGAGPKKMYPLRFCIYSRDDHGRDVYGLYHEATNTLEVTGIGTGFLMITRACAERMAAAYPELEFDPGEGQVEHGLFDAVYVNKTRFSDDFAFCWRWRQIGGKVHVMPSIKLSHVGSHTFTGSLEDAMLAEVPAQAAE